MSFDVEGALSEGYTLPEIASHLAASKKFDLAGARKEGYSDEEIIGHLNKAPKPPTPGFISAVKSGMQSIAGDYEATKAAFGKEGSEAAAAEHRKKAGEQYQLPEFTDKPWEYVKGLAGQSLPYLAAPLVAGAVAGSAPVTGALGLGAAGATALGLGAAGVASAGQFTGSNISRQLESGTAAKDVNVLGAVAAAIPQAAMDVASLKMMPIVGRIFERAGIKASEVAAQGAIKQALLGTVKTASTEGLTEAGQQVLERLQAGLNITDKEARDEYFQSFLGGAVLGGAIGLPGHAIEGMGAKQAAPTAPTAPAIPEAPTPTAPTGLPDTYAAAVQEAEFLKQQPQTEEIKNRLAQLQAYQTRLVSDDIAATKRQPFAEPTSLEGQIQNQSATQGEFREMMDLPTQEAPIAETPEAPEKEMPTVLAADVLDRTGLTKQSGLYKQLLGKDLTNLEDLDAVMQTVERAKTNKSLTPDTKNALETLATQAFNIYGKQRGLFDVEAPPAKLTPVLKKITAVTAGKDMNNPADVATIREQLTDYANGANRSAKSIQEISDYIDSLPVAPAESVAPVAEEVIQETPVEQPIVEPAPVEPAAVAPVEAVGEPAPAVQATLAEELEAPPATQAAEFIKKTRKKKATPVAEVPAVEEIPAPVAKTPEAPVTPAVEEPIEGKLTASKAIHALVANGVTRSSATDFINTHVDSFGYVDTKYVNAAVKKVGGKAKYREAEVGTNGMPKGRVSAIVAAMSDKWVNAPKINVVQSITDLPQFLQDQIKKDGVNPKGAFDPDSKEVFLVADNITNDVDVAMTLAHEALGHFGLRSLLGGKFNSIMNTIYEGNKEVKLRADNKIDAGVDKETAVEEVLAEMAEEVANPDAKKNAHKLNALQRVVNAIRQFFAGLGFPLRGVTDGEIRGLIVNARAEVISQEYKIGAGRLAQKAEGTTTGKPLYKTKPLTPEGEAAAALNERMKGISNPQENGGDATAKSMLGINHFFTRTEGPGFITRLRRHVADKDATVIEKLQTAFDNKLVDSLGNARADLMSDQAQDTAGFTENVLENGGIGIGKDNLVHTFKAEHGASMKKVFDQLKAFGDKLGSLDLGMQVAHNALIANRANEINKFNAGKRQEIAAAEAKGNTKAAELLEKQIITIKASQAEIDAGLEAMKKYPEIKEILETFTTYKNGLIDFMVECGRINEETARNWKENAGYVPWTRIEEEVDSFDSDTTGAYKSGLINLSKLPKLDKEGSSKEIANVFDNMIGFTSWAIKSGLKNRAATAMAEQLPDAKEIKTDNELKLEQKRNKDRVIYTYKKGERTAYLLGSALDMSAFSTNIEVLGPLMQGAKFVGDFLRGAITHMPAFALSQLIQDGTYRGMLLSGVERPFSLPPKVFANFAKALRGELDHIQALGITGVYDGMPEHAMERAKIKYGIKQQSAAKNAWGKLEKFSMAADLAVRAAIYEQTMEETNGDTQLALYRAKEYINFKRSGASSTIRTLRHVVPFMNAYIQGMDVLVRTMRGKGVSLQDKRKAQQLFLATGLKLAALSAAYTMMASGDDDYEGLEEYERDKNYIIPGTGIKIPVAPEVGFLFKVIPERLIRYVVSQGTERPQDAETFYKGFRDAFVNAYGGPSMMPQAVKPVLEIAVNYSFFTGNPIVGQSMKNVDPSNQFTSGTSEFAKLFGAIGISPLKVDYLVRGYTGMVGAIALDMTDAIANPDRMGKPINKLPQISTFMYDPSGRGYKSEFYKFRESVDQVVDTVNLFKREGRAEELKEYLTPEKLQLYAMRGVAGKVEESLGKLRKYRNVIANDPGLSSEEKRAKTDAIQKQEKEILLAYNVPRLRQMAKPKE